MKGAPKDGRPVWLIEFRTGRRVPVAWDNLSRVWRSLDLKESFPDDEELYEWRAM